MAGYLSWRISEGFLDYVTIFSNNIWKSYKEETDTLLREKNRADLIVLIE